MAILKSADERTQNQILAKLAELGGKRAQHDELNFSGHQFTLPASYQGDIPRAIAFLEEYQEVMEAEHLFQKVFRYRPWDGAHAFQSALRKLGQATLGQATFSFFGKQPPAMPTINVGPNETTQVPWGKVSLPLVKGTAYLQQSDDEELGALFALAINAPKKFAAEIEALFVLIEAELSQNSIYKGKAIDGKEMPEFLDFSGLDPRTIVYSEETYAQLDGNLWGPIKYAQTMREEGLSLKRAILLEGPYGTGKSLTGLRTAQIATSQEEPFTFIFCKPGRDDLLATMQTARLYEPSVVFFEDVDSVSRPGHRNDQVTKLLDAFDGITAKGVEIIVVLTTNHVEKIHKGMLRPGRLDSLIHIGALDRPGVQTMTETTVRPDLLDPDLKYAEIAEAMDGFMPAFVKEAITRALRYAIAREGGVPNKLVTSDFVNAAKGLRAHYELMERATESITPDGLSVAIHNIVHDVIDKAKVVDANDGEHTWTIEAAEDSGSDLPSAGDETEDEEVEA